MQEPISNQNQQEFAIELNNVSRLFAEHIAVCELSLQIPQNQVIGLLGLNGAGKSTSLQMLAGTLAPSLGNIKILGLDIQLQAEIAKQDIGYLPEVPPIYKEQTVDEYLNFICALYNVEKTQYSELIQKAKEQCGLLEVSSRRIGNLSKGYQQRIGIAQAIVHQPKIVILDEPTVGLDPQQLISMREMVRSLAEHSTVIFSSHILSEVCAVADRIVMLHEGKLVHDGPNENQNNLEDLFSQIILKGVS